MTRHWTDEEILGHQFLIRGRPDQEPGLVLVRPDLAGLRFLQSYDASPPAGGTISQRKQVSPYVWCVLCQKPTNWIGWVAENAAGDRFLIGNRCARKHGAQEIRAAERDFKVQVRRQELLQRRQRFLARAGAVEAALSRWSTSEDVAAVSQWTDQFGSTFPRLRDELAKAARQSPPVLLQEIRIRDLAREQRRPPGSGDTPIYRTELQRVATLPSYVALGPDSLSVRIERLARRVRKARELLKPDTVSQAQMAEALKDGLLISAATAQLVESLRTLDQWNDRGLWNAIAAWGSEALTNASYSIEKGTRVRGCENQFRNFHNFRLPRFPRVRAPAELTDALEALATPDDS